MITMLIILGIIAAYIAIGCTLARIARPKIIEHNTYYKGERYWSRYWDRFQHREQDGIWRSEVTKATWQLILGWPIASWVFVVTLSLRRTMDASDPHLQQVRIKEQQRRIEELEQELKIQ